MKSKINLREEERRIYCESQEDACFQTCKLQPFACKSSPYHLLSTVHWAKCQDHGPPPPPQEVAKDSSQKRHYQKPIVYECAFGIENEPECQRSRIASRTLSGKTVRCSSNRFVQVPSPLTPSLISGNFSRNLGVLCSVKARTLLSTLKGKRN